MVVVVIIVVAIIVVVGLGLGLGLELVLGLVAVAVAVAVAVVAAAVTYARFGVMWFFEQEIKELCRFSGYACSCKRINRLMQFFGVCVGF